MHLVGTEEKMIKVRAGFCSQVPKDCDPLFHVLNVPLMDYYKGPLDLVSILFQSARCIFLRLH